MHPEGTCAKRTDWQTVPLPSTTTTITVDRLFDAAQLARVRAGVVPREMADKWFIFFEDGVLNFHRSWTGFCVYRLSGELASASWRASRLEVNRDPEQYSETDDAKDLETVNWLIDVLLLGIQAPDGVRTGQELLALWGLVGRASLGQSPTSAR